MQSAVQSLQHQHFLGHRDELESVQRESARALARFDHRLAKETISSGKPEFYVRYDGVYQGGIGDFGPGAAVAFVIADYLRFYADGTLLYSFLKAKMNAHQVAKHLHKDSNYGVQGHYKIQDSCIEYWLKTSHDSEELFYEGKIGYQYDGLIRDTYIESKLKDKVGSEMRYRFLQVRVL